MGPQMLDQETTGDGENTVTVIFFVRISSTLPETNSSHLKSWMVGRLVFFWDGLFSRAFAVSFRECICSRV